MAIKSLLVGINTYLDVPLHGCVNDVARMADLLTRSYGVAGDRMRTLTDSAATRAAILDGLRWLAQADAGETNPVRLFHFSGHGTQQHDQDGDEPDGYDECLVPYDWADAGFITDDVLSEIYNNSFASDAHLLLVMDCCHAGGSQRDISNNITYRFLKRSAEEDERIKAAAARYDHDRNQFIHQGERELWQRGDRPSQDEIVEFRAELGQRFDDQRSGQEALKGNTVLLAACRSEQSAADATIGDTWGGAFTYYLTEALATDGGQPTYSALIEQVRAAMLGAERFTQEPRLECADEWKQRLFLHDSQTS